jgi:hypothetical protein
MVKKLAPWAVVALILFYVISNPSGAATSAHRLGSALASAADALGRFFTGVFTG